MGFRVKQVQQTPNPNAVKLVLDQAVWQQPISFFGPEAAVDHPLAARLFEIPGVCGLLLLGDFVTISRSPEAKWSDIVRRARQVLAKA